MITCPVCANRQAQGVECDVCGLPLPASLVREEGHAARVPEPVPGFEPTALDGGVERIVPLAADAPCVWCGHVQASGSLCERCGMQRHRGIRRTEAVEAADAEGGVRCPECGLIVLPAARCPNCGGRLPSEP